MNKLKSVITAAVLTLALAVSAAGHQPPDCKPGENANPAVPVRSGDVGKPCCGVWRNANPAKGSKLWRSSRS